MGAGNYLPSIDGAVFFYIMWPSIEDYREQNVKDVENGDCEEIYDDETLYDFVRMDMYDEIEYYCEELKAKYKSLDFVGENKSYGRQHMSNNLVDVYTVEWDDYVAFVIDPQEYISDRDMPLALNFLKKIEKGVLLKAVDVFGKRAYMSSSAWTCCPITKEYVEEYC